MRETSGERNGQREENQRLRGSEQRIVRPADWTIGPDASLSSYCVPPENDPTQEVYYVQLKVDDKYVLKVTSYGVWMQESPARNKHKHGCMKSPFNRYILVQTVHTYVNGYVLHVFDLFNIVQSSLRGCTWFVANDEADIVTAFRQAVAHIDGSHAADGISRLPHRWQRTVDNLGDYFDGCLTARHEPRMKTPVTRYAKPRPGRHTRLSVVNEKETPWGHSSLDAALDHYTRRSSVTNAGSHGSNLLHTSRGNRPGQSTAPSPRFGRLLTSRSLELARVERGGYGAAPECKSGKNGWSVLVGGKQSNHLTTVAPYPTLCYTYLNTLSPSKIDRGRNLKRKKWDKEQMILVKDVQAGTMGYKSAKSTVERYELVECCVGIDKRFYGLRKHAIKRMTNYQSSRNGWLFFKRHLQLSLLVPQGISHARIKCAIPENVANFFKLYEPEFDQIKGRAPRLYNVDEMGVTGVEHRAE
ncbi:hypothetical protein PR048_001893 [Dryococelus australis]|uniref:Transposase n=1 Tax=Dryococelus australis TaxID=614101 RepID=A0ABQ9IIS4_9NEOP|nr:hypothetical protein PR048_001893 [Dryococelus australis]